MSTYIVLDPRLQISPQAFAAAWNAEPSCRAAAVAEVRPVPTPQFDPALAEAVSLLAGTVAAGIATNALYDLITLALLRQGVTRRTRIELLERPDGTRLMAVTIEEE